MNIEIKRILWCFYVIGVVLFIGWIVEDGMNIWLGGGLVINIIGVLINMNIWWEDGE